MFSDERICVFIPDIYNFDGNSFLGGFVNTSENIAAFGEVEMIVKPVGVVLYFFPELVAELSVHYF